MEEAAKFISLPETNIAGYVGELRCYGNHVSCLFRTMRPNPKFSAHVVGDSIIIEKVNY